MDTEPNKIEEQEEEKVDQHQADQQSNIHRGNSLTLLPNDESPQKNNSSTYQYSQTPQHQTSKDTEINLYRNPKSSQGKRISSQTKEQSQQTNQTEVTRTNLNSASTSFTAIKVLSILNFDPNSDVEPILNSPRSLQACKLAGFPPSSLVKKLVLPEEKKLMNTAYLTKEGIWMVSENQEKRRQEKVNKVIEYREKIISDSLTKEEKKLIEDPEALNGGESRMVSPMRTTNRSESLRYSYTFCQTSPDSSMRLERTRQLRAEEIDKQKKGKIELHYKQEDEVLKVKEQKIFARQSITAHNVCVIKELREQQLKEEARKMKEKQEAALQQIEDQKGERQQRVETSYWKKHKQFLLNKQKQDEYIQQQCESQREKKDLTIQQKKEIRDKLIQMRVETIKTKLEDKFNVVQEKQKWVETLRRRESENKNKVVLEASTRIQSANILCQSHSIDPKYHNLPLEVAKELQLQERASERKQKESIVKERKLSLEEQFSKTAKQEFKQRQNQSTTNIKQLSNIKHDSLIRIRSQNLMRSLNVQDNHHSILYVKSARNTAYMEKVSSRDYLRVIQTHDMVQTNKDRELTYNKLNQEKQKIKCELEQMFQKKRKADIPSLGSKYSIELESEDKILSKSMADLSKYKKLITSPYKPGISPYSQTSIQRGNQ